MKKRPGLNEFIEEMSQIFEIIIFTSSLEEVIKIKISFFFHLINPHQSSSIPINTHQSPLISINPIFSFLLIFLFCFNFFVSFFFFNFFEFFYKKYADSVISLIDPKKKIPIRLFRENCIVHQNRIVKSLEALHRNLKDVIIIDVN